jgi:hypothetical protein
MSLREMLSESGEDPISFHFPHHKLGECKGHRCSQKIALHNRKTGLLLQFMSTIKCTKNNGLRTCDSFAAVAIPDTQNILFISFEVFVEIGIHKSFVDDLNSGYILVQDRSSQFICRIPTSP